MTEGRRASVSDELETNLETSLWSVPGSGGRSPIRLVRGIRVSDDLPAGGGVAHVGGAPAAARPRQEAKAAAGRVEKTGLRSDL